MSERTTRADADISTAALTARTEAAESTTGQRGRLAAVRDSIGALVGAILGLAPHVLHHIGLIAGAALVTGATGNALFFGIGLFFSIPLLRRLHRRFGTWRAPAIAVLVFAAVFSLSAFVIGPAISGGADDGPPTPEPSPTETHSDHHG